MIALTTPATTTVTGYQILCVTEHHESGTVTITYTEVGGGPQFKNVQCDFPTAAPFMAGPSPIRIKRHNLLASLLGVAGTIT